MRIAAIDLGSNSFHLVVVDAQPDGSFDVLVREKEVLRLGDVVAATGRIGPEHGERAVDAMRRMASVIGSVGAEEVVAYATSALREADDSAAICDAIFDETGIEVDVISGRHEARLIFGAVRRSITITKPPAVCLDLGGGSLEVSVGDAGGLLWSTSVRLGVGRLATSFLTSDPPSERDVKRLREHVTVVLAPVVEQVRSFEPGMLIGTSGTLCDLATMAAINRTGVAPPSLNQLTVKRRDLNEVHARLLSSTSEERAKFDGLEPRRADQIPAGSIVLLTAMKLLDLNELTVGDWALREGMLLDAIDRHDLADWSSDPEAVRRTSVLALARRCAFDEAHASAVARLAGGLFDQTLPLHRLPQRSRLLLEYAALLHDIGEHVAVDGHNKHTAYLIQHGQLKGFEPAEVDMLATLGRYHRRSGPGSSFEPWRRLEREEKDETLVLLSLLRIADGLDRGHLGVVDGVDVEIDKKQVRILVAATGDADLELWGVRRKRELFESVFDRKLELVAADHPAVRARVLRRAGA
ncbi:MAG TPA: Ppx/GppA phosphatase family protein [Acidimicrobiales bacterium]|jgi:exopolyphosphatase / guanosine-5'-triphosphate,3'-diphosphate pyrophosphatase|nr:Ppx/GppA phosphatase family protein [Acidimicrobiales bacterium]